MCDDPQPAILAGMCHAPKRVCVTFSFLGGVSLPLNPFPLLLSFGLLSRGRNCEVGNYKEPGFKIEAEVFLLFFNFFAPFFFLRRRLLLLLFLRIRCLRRIPS